MPSRPQTRSTTPIVPFAPKPAPITLEQAGITAGSRFLATPEQAEEIAARDRDITDAKIAVLDASLASVFACRCCGAVAGIGAGNVCAPCRSVAAQIVAERRSAELVGGTTRRELVERFLSEQS